MGGVAFQMGGFMCGGCPMGRLVEKKIDGGGSKKKIVGRGDAPMPPPLWKTLPPNPTPFSLLLFGKP